MADKEFSGSALHDLDQIIAALSVCAIDVHERLLSPCQEIDFKESRHTSIYYLREGKAFFQSRYDEGCMLPPHTLVAIPAHSSFSLGFPGQFGQRSCTGDNVTPSILVGGTFSTCYGASIDLFATLPEPIAVKFESSDGIGLAMTGVVKENNSPSVGSKTMVSALMKQILVSFIRMSLSSNNLWIKNFTVFNDPAIAKTFAAMIATPEQPHSLISLAELSCMSRSTFSTRFTHAVGRSPMVALREIRMSRAAALLLAGHNTLDQVMYHAGYTSRGSFVRAFRNTHGLDPSHYRDNLKYSPQANVSSRDVPEGMHRLNQLSHCTAV